jgi:hypothetical protein
VVDTKASKVNFPNAALELKRECGKFKTNPQLRLQVGTRRPSLNYGSKETKPANSRRQMPGVCPGALLLSRHVDYVSSVIVEK